MFAALGVSVISPKAAAKTAKKSASKPAKKAAKKAAKKSASKAAKPAKKSTAKSAKKATAKKSVAKKPAKKAAAKKPATKKAPAKPAKKATAKKSATKKATAKKSATKKASAKKPAATTAKKKTAKATKKSAAKKPSTKAPKKSAKKAAKKTTKKAVTKPTKPTKAKKASMNSPEVRDVARKLGVLALARMKQTGRLGVRQKEQLRRAMASAGVHLRWEIMASSAPDPAARATKDIAKLVTIGSSILEDERAAELAAKKAEVTNFKKASKTLLAMSEDADSVYPAEVIYQHTARDGSQGYVTKTITITPADGTEAASASASIEKSLESWTKLKDQMLEVIKKRQKELVEMRSTHDEFVEATQVILREVLATLH